jgi:hypothetical protein
MIYMTNINDIIDRLIDNKTHISIHLQKGIIVGYIAARGDDYIEFSGDKHMPKNNIILTKQIMYISIYEN